MLGELQLVKKKINGGNPAVPGNDEISTSVCWRLTTAARYPLDPPAIAHFLRLGYWLISKVRMSSLDRARDSIDLDRWRYTEALVPRLEGRRPSRFRHPARIAGRYREAPCVGRDDEARGVRGRARQNRATAGRGDDTTGRRDRVPAPGCSPGLEGH